MSSFADSYPHHAQAVIDTAVLDQLNYTGITKEEFVVYPLSRFHRGYYNEENSGRAYMPHNAAKGIVLPIKPFHQHFEEFLKLNNPQPDRGQCLNELKS